MRKNNKIIEILFILFIFFILTSCKEKEGFDMRKAHERFNERVAKPDATKATLRGIDAGIQLYYNGDKETKGHYKYPESLDELIEKGYCRTGGNVDAWSNKINYEVDKDEKGNIISYKLYSSGPDKKRGTNDDIYTKK